MKAEKFLTAMLLATGTAVYATFTEGGDGAVTPIELSGFAAGMLKAALAVGLFWAFDRYVLDEVDTVAELKAGNVAYALALLALAVLLTAAEAGKVLGGVSAETVMEYVRGKGLPCLRPGKRPLFRLADLQAWAERYPNGERAFQ